VETWDLVRDVVVTLGVALVFGVAAQALRQSPVIGYLVAGLFLGGPSSLGLVQDVHALEGMAELGVAMLMFTIGLDFSLGKLRRFGRVAVIGGILQVVLTAGITAVAAIVLGLSTPAAIVVGMVVAFSSTAVVVRVLLDNAQIDSNFGLAAVGVLLVQDIVLIPFLLLIPDLSGDVGVGGALLTLGISVAKVAGLAVAMYIVDYLVVARAFDRVGGAAEREELLVLMTFVIAFGAAWATYAMGLSAALGAFLAGLLIAGAPYADHVRAEIGPLRVLFVTLFFAAIGMLADAGYILDHLGVVVGLAAVVIVGKTLLAGAAIRMAGTATTVALLGGLALAQMGEFSFVLATAALSEGIFSEDTFQLVVSVSLVTLLLTPPLLDLANRISARLAEVVSSGEEDEGDTVAPRSHQFVVVGYGPAGQRVVERLHAQGGADITVVELNPKLGEGAPARVLHGDASKLQILRRAGVPRAGSVTITIPDPTRAQGIARRVRALAPDTRIIVRGRYHRTLEQLAQSGADTVVDEETETGERLAAATLAGSD
jgi:monovalent cation:H+ antiporter-2, CPA2 family